MTPRAVYVLGVGQCVSWGVLYYAFTVLLLPVQRDLAVPRWVVAAAFSLGLLMSALGAPTVGRWIDRGHGARVMQAGGFTAAGLLALWALMPTVLVLYVVWTGLGLCMAATLYEPAFAIVGRAQAGPQERLRAIATVSVFGGLASTVFLPLTALLVSAFDWRITVGVLALVLALSTQMTRWWALSGLPEAPVARPPESSGIENDTDSRDRPPRFLFVLLVFSVASLASAAFTSNLVPALGARDIPATSAAMLGALFGLMQLPGRALLMRQGVSASPSRLLVISLILQALGLVLLALSWSAAVVAVAIAVFAVGAGLATLVRPHLVQTAFGIARAGYLNGQLARSQQLARAAGPVMAVWVAAAAGYGVVFMLLGSMFAALALASRHMLGSRTQGRDIEAGRGRFSGIPPAPER
jgi:MFS family permease